MKPEILQFIRCPVTGSRVRIAKKDLIGRLNQAIGAGLIVTRKGGTVHAPIEGGLVNDDGSIFIPCRDGIYCLSADDAIELGQIKI